MVLVEDLQLGTEHRHGAAILHRHPSRGRGIAGRVALQHAACLVLAHGRRRGQQRRERLVAQSPLDERPCRLGCLGEADDAHPQQPSSHSRSRATSTAAACAASARVAAAAFTSAWRAGLPNFFFLAMTPR